MCKLIVVIALLKPSSVRWIFNLKILSFARFWRNSGETGKSSCWYRRLLFELMHSQMALILIQQIINMHRLYEEESWGWDLKITDEVCCSFWHENLAIIVNESVNLAFTDVNWKGFEIFYCFTTHAHHHCIPLRFPLSPDRPTEQQNDFPAQSSCTSYGWSAASHVNPCSSFNADESSFLSTTTLKCCVTWIFTLWWTLLI